MARLDTGAALIIASTESPAIEKISRREKEINAGDWVDAFRAKTRTIKIHLGRIESGQIAPSSSYSFMFSVHGTVHCTTIVFLCTANLNHALSKEESYQAAGPLQAKDVILLSSKNPHCLRSTLPVSFRMCILF